MATKQVHGPVTLLPCLRSCWNHDPRHFGAGKCADKHLWWRQAIHIDVYFWLFFVHLALRQTTQRKTTQKGHKNCTASVCRFYQSSFQKPLWLSHFSLQSDSLRFSLWALVHKMELHYVWSQIHSISSSLTWIMIGANCTIYSIVCI